MSVNLVSLISGYLTPDVTGRIASALGIDRTLAGRSAAALAPAILGSLAHVASTPGGASKVANAVNQQSPNILDTLSSAIGGAGQQTLVRDGTNALNALLGGSASSQLVSAVGKVTGISQAAGSSLVGLLTPAVLGLLRREQTSRGLDASGLAQLLTAQKDNISAALPSGFANALRASGVPGYGAQNVGQISDPNSWSWRWVLGVVAAAALAWWWFHPGKVATPRVEQQTRVEPQTQTTVDAGRAFTVDGVDVKSSLESSIAGLKAGLQDIRDTSSATTVLPQLQKVAAEFDKLRELAPRLPAENRNAFAVLVTAARPTLIGLFNQILAIPGVDAIARPTINTLVSEIDALAKV